jgi:hypothetical protein
MARRRQRSRARKLEAVKRANKVEANAVWDEIDRLFPALIVKR